MARARNIKPGFFTNELLGECQPLARLLFAGLWCWADRVGRLEERVKRLKAEILPYDDCDVDRLLAELDTRGFIIRYKAAGHNFIQIVNFRNHQNPHVNERPSTIQAPEEHSTNHADSLLLIPSSLIPESKEICAIGDGTSVCDSTGTGTASKPTATPTEDEENPTAKPPANGYPPAFEEFWTAYPNRGGRKRGKYTSYQIWKTIPAKERQAVVQAATAYATGHGGFIRDPERFLKSKWWEDWLKKLEPEPESENGASVDWVKQLRAKASAQVKEDLHDNGRV